MYKFHFLITLLFLTLISLFFISGISASDNPPYRTPTPSKSILLAKGFSILENEVARLVKDSLAKHGYTVRVVHIDTVANENPDNYRVTLFFNAMKTAGLMEPARRYLMNSVGRKSKVLVCTVTGELWQTTDPVVDAVTAATEDLWPPDVAGRVLKSVYDIVGAP